MEGKGKPLGSFHAFSSFLDIEMSISQPFVLGLSDEHTLTLEQSAVGRDLGRLKQAGGVEGSSDVVTFAPGAGVLFPLLRKIKAVRDI